MNQLKVFENDLFKVSAKAEGEQILFDVEQVAKSLGFTESKNDKVYIRWRTVNGYLGKQLSQNVAKGDFIPEPLVYKLAFKASNELAEKFQDWLAIEVIPSIRKTGSYEQPKSSAEMLLKQAELMVEYEQRINQAESNIAAAHHRIDNMDKIDTIGDKRQRLNKMIQRYASEKGIQFNQAWRNFRQSFNTAYRENLTMRVENYKLNNNVKKLSMPDYLERVGRLDDAIRVADKLMNQSDRGAM